MAAIVHSVESGFLRQRAAGRCRLRVLAWAVLMALVGVGGPVCGVEAVVRLPFDLSGAWPWADPLVMDVAAGGKALLRAEVRPGRTEVSVPGTSRPAIRIDRRLAPGEHLLQVRLRADDTAAVCLDGEMVAELAVASARGRVTAMALPGGERLTLKGEPRVQRLDEVIFADDFAREPEAPSQWDAHGGRFALNTSLNPGSSQSAFQFWASAPAGRGMALATASHWFWDDLEYGVSAMAPRLPATWGVVVHWRDPENFHEVTWHQPADGQPGTLRLSRHRAGVETVLGSVPVTMIEQQWYRLTVLTMGARARVFLGGAEVLAVEDPFLTGGRFGLCIEAVRDLYFDDASARTPGRAAAVSSWTPPQPFGPGEQTWSDFSQKSFISDPFMMQWSHPRSFWAAEASSGLSWFRTRLFGDVTLTWSRAGRQAVHWPRTEVTAVVFADRDQDDPGGYRVTLGKDRLALSRAGREVAAKDLAIESLDAFRLAVREGAVEVTVNGQSQLAWQDPEPLRKGDVGLRLGPTYGLSLGRPDWRDSTRVESSQRLDYGFDGAPTAWAVGAGRWQGTHRWACVPKWSFFGGRGEPGAAEVSHGQALLWNLRRFTGDIDVEIFAAPMEGTPQWVHFAHPANIQVAFAADGINFDSGYLFEFGLYDSPSRLFRAGQPLAAWDRRLAPALRQDSLPWYNRMSRVWQHLRIQRRGERILIDADRHDDQGHSMGLERLFDIRDEDVLSGDRLGVWTWGPNGLALARATISFEHSPGPAPAPAVVPRRSAASGGRGGPAAVTRVRNPQSGGSFDHDLIEAPVDLAEKGVLSFAMRTEAALALSLVARLRSQTAEMALVGPATYRQWAIPLGAATLTPSSRWPGWTEVRADLATPLRAAFPSGRLILDRLAIASPCDSLEQIAGLGVNRCGDAYDLAEVRWEASPASAATPPRPTALAVSLHGQRPLDDFEADTGAWERLGGPDGAALYRDAHEPSAGDGALRLLNQVVGGPAGAWITREAFSLQAFPRLRFDYRLGPGTELNLLVKADGRWFEVRFTGVDATWPVLGSIAGVKADGQWHTAEVDLQGLLRRRLGQGPGRIEALALADTNRMSSWQRTACWVDNVCRVPALDPAAPTLVSLALSDGTAPVAFSHSLDAEPGTDPGTTPTGQGSSLSLTPPAAAAWLHLRGRRPDGSWTPPLHLPVVVAPPGPALAGPPAAPTPTGLPKAPTIVYMPSDRLCFEDFEWSQSPEDPDARFGDTAVRRGAWVLRGEGDGAASEGSLVVQNLEDGSFFSAYLHRSAWDPLRWPVLSFDYRFEQPGCALNLTMLVNEAMAAVGWTGRNIPGTYFYDSLLGSTAPARQDGAWHHIEIDLGAMITEKLFPNPDSRVRITVSELATWATNHHGGGYVNPATARVRFDNLCIASRRGRDPAFFWRLPHDSAPAEGYAVRFDQEPETTPDEAVTGTAARFTQEDVAPGTWYLHVRAKGREGWGPTAHCRIVIE